MCDHDEHWDCPTCLRPMPPEHDHRCSTCDMFASQHISVTAMCRILREVSGREASLIVEVNEQARLLGMSAERECDLRGELERERALADRLAGVFEFYFSEDDEIHIAGIKSRNATTEALAAWKEARND